MYQHQDRISTKAFDTNFRLFNVLSFAILFMPVLFKKKITVTAHSGRLDKCIDYMTISNETLLLTK
jgi:hypothetical protein